MNIVFYICHFVNDFSKRQFYKLKTELPSNYDVIWWLDDNCQIELPSDITFIKFPHSSIQIKHLKGVINPTKYFETYFLNNEWVQKYQYYWFIEYDVYLNGNWGDFFVHIDGNYNDDLISEYIRFKENDIKWPFYCKKYLKQQLLSTVSIYRLSNKAAWVLANYDKNEKIIQGLYENYIPTIIYNADLLICGLDKVLTLKEFQKGLNYIEKYDDFKWDVVFDDEKQMNGLNKLYTRYKSDKNLK